MADREQVRLLIQGVDVWNEWRKNNPTRPINLGQAEFRGDNLNKINLNKAFLQMADFSYSTFKEADLSSTDLRKADLFGAEFTGANLCQADLRGADLGGAHFVKADFRGAKLSHVNLFDANLTGALLEEVDLSWSNLIGANLDGANLRNANLSNTDMRVAHMKDTDLNGADLKGAELTRVKLDNTVLSGAITSYTSFGFDDLRKIIGLDEINHQGPSSLGIETLALSKGKIPESFLRKCGLSDLDIEYSKLANPGLDPEQVTDITYKIHRLYLGGGIQYFSCFISHNNKDEAFAKQLHDDLQNNGVRCWFAPEDLKIGDSIRTTIDQQIRRKEKLLVILSENSVQSEWVGDEVEAALEEESKSNRLVLFPIRLDDAVMNTRDDWAAKIKRRRHIGDFSNWKDKASYQKAFERLLRDLKATGGGVNGE